MKTECNIKSVHFAKVKCREVQAAFDGASITSDAGLLLLRECNNKYKITQKFSECFMDYRVPEYCQHSVYQLVTQRIFALCAGKEDLIDHDQLRQDSLYSLLVEKEKITQPIAGKSTLNRLEKAASGSNEKYRKIVVKEDAVADLLVDQFLSAYQSPPNSIVLDIDATDDPIHGNQEGKFFHGYYGHYCYLPLYVFCNGFALVSKLRVANIDAAEGAVEELQRVVRLIREKWPKVHILIRGDSGFCRDELMKWIEREENTDYIFGIARNPRLERMICDQMNQVEVAYKKSLLPQREFIELFYQPLNRNWGKERRVIAKAEYLAKGRNPRFIITSLKDEKTYLYESVYCARGAMENRIKEQQLYLFADRLSCNKIKENQLRLWFSTIAYNLLHLFRMVALIGTEMENAQCHTIRDRLLKIGGMIKVTVRRIYISLSEGFAWKHIFFRARAFLSSA